MEEEPSRSRIELVFLRGGFLEINKTAEEIDLLNKSEPREAMHFFYKLIPAKAVYVSTSGENKTVKRVIEAITVGNCDPY